MKYKIGFLLISSLVLTACTKAPVTNQPANSDPTPTQAASPRSLKDLLAGGQSQQCTWQSQENGDSISGQILISSNKFKQVSRVSTPQGEVEIIAVSDGQSVYTWNNQTNNTGFKVKLDQLPTPSAPSDSNTPRIDMDKELDYHCTPAAVSDQDLAVPQEINFVDITSGVPNVQELIKTMPGIGVEE